MDDLKEVIDTKDATIEELQHRLAHPSKGALRPDPATVLPSQVSHNENISVLSQAIKEREEKIEDLQEKLEQASKVLESSADLIENAKGGKHRGGVDPMRQSLLQVKGELHTARERIGYLEGDLAEAEEAAHDKAEELCEALARVRVYEQG